MSGLSFFHILNPSRRHHDSVKQFFDLKKGIPHAWVERASHPTHLETIIQWALLEGHHRVVVWGGDGSFSRAVQAFFAEGGLSKAQVGLVPVGTCNDFARKLGLANWRAIAEAYISNNVRERRYDLGQLESEFEKRIFVNNAGFGRSTEALKRTRPSAVKDIFSFTEKQIDLQIDSKAGQYARSFKAILGLVFNAPFFNGGMHFDRAIEPDDGALTLFLVPPYQRWRLLFKFLKSRFGVPLADSNMLRADARSFEMVSDGELNPQVDGEPVKHQGVRKLKFSVLKGALPFWIPNS